MPQDDPAVCPYCGKPCVPPSADEAFPGYYWTQIAEVPGWPGRWYHLRCFGIIMDSAFKAVDL